MNLTIWLRIAGIMCFAGACNHVPSNTSKSAELDWLRLHDGEEGLKGIKVNPWTEVMGSEKYYSESKPFEVIYVFNDGKIHVVDFDIYRNKNDYWTTIQKYPIKVEEIHSLQFWKEQVKVP